MSARVPHPATIVLSNPFQKAGGCAVVMAPILQASEYVSDEHLRVFETSAFLRRSPFGKPLGHLSESNSDDNI